MKCVGFFNWMKHLTFTCAGCGWLSNSIILKNNCLDCELRGLWNNLSFKKKTGGGIFTGTRRWNHIISSTPFFFLHQALVGNSYNNVVLFLLLPRLSPNLCLIWCPIDTCTSIIKSKNKRCLFRSYTYPSE